MIRLELDDLRAITAGRWVQRPTPGGAIVGVGIDTREDLAGRLFVAIRGARFDGHEFLAAAAAGGAAAAVIAEDASAGPMPPGLAVIAVGDTRRALGRLAHEHRVSLAATKVIAVTGSCGKTTTKRLLHAVLAAGHRGTAAPRSFNNDIGVPLTLLAAQTGDRYVVVEVGTNAPGEIGQLAAVAEPDVAVITSIGPSHLAAFETVEAVAREKTTLLAALRPKGLAVLCADAPHLEAYARMLPSVVRYGAAPTADLRLTARGADRRSGRWWLEVNGRTRFPLGLPGRHNAINALAAIAVGRRFGLDDERIGAALGAVEPIDMRLAPRTIAFDGGTVTLYDDAYNANPQSMAAALETYGELAVEAPRRVLVLGDMLELGPAAPAHHRAVGQAILELDARCPIAHVILVGPLARHIGEPLQVAWPASRLSHARQLDRRALTRLRRRFQPGDAVLLKGSRGIGLERLAAALETPPRSGRTSTVDIRIADAGRRRDATAARRRR